MTKKDYLAIAQAIKDAKRNDPDGWAAIGFLIVDLCAYFKQDNPRFDERQFKEACYGKD